jgi:hypothetical protein
MICGITDRKKALHCLETADSTEVNTILEWTHRNESTCKETFPILKQTVGRRHDEGRDDEYDDLGESRYTGRWKGIRSLLEQRT